MALTSLSLLHQEREQAVLLSLGFLISRKRGVSEDLRPECLCRGVMVVLGCYTRWKPSPLIHAPQTIKALKTIIRYLFNTYSKNDLNHVMALSFIYMMTTLVLFSPAGMPVLNFRLVGVYLVFPLAGPSGISHSAG